MRYALYACPVIICLAGSCGGDRAEGARSGQITAPHFQEPKLFLQTGLHWSLGGEQRSNLPVGRDGGFEVPRAVRHVTAFVDTDGNGLLDAHTEPSTRCRLVAERWECHIPPRSLTAHTLELVPFPHSSNPADRFEALSIIAEQYEQSGALDTSARFCIEGESECAELVRETYGPGQSEDLRIGPCKTQKAFERGTPITVRATSDHERKEFVFSPPDQMGLRVAAHRDDLGMEVLAHTQRSMTHAIVWLGSMDARNVAWSTELDPEAMSFSARQLEVRVPERAIDRCRGCKLMVQVANVEAGPVTLVAEARTAIGDLQR